MSVTLVFQVGPHERLVLAHVDGEKEGPIGVSSAQLSEGLEQAREIDGAVGAVGGSRKSTTGNRWCSLRVKTSDLPAVQAALRGRNRGAPGSPREAKCGVGGGSRGESPATVTAGSIQQRRM